MSWAVWGHRLWPRHTLLCFDKALLEYCSWSHDWHAEFLKRNVISGKCNFNIIPSGFMECSWRYWLSVQSKKKNKKPQQHIQDIEQMGETFLSGRQQEAVLKQSCRTELWQSSHFDLQSALFGDRRKLNPIGSIAGTLLHSAFFFFFFILAEIKALCQGGIVINLQVLPFRHFPCGARGKRKVTAALKWLLCMQGEAWMYACSGILTQESACSTLSWPTRACMTW